jgi:hypothetical protein
LTKAALTANIRKGWNGKIRLKRKVEWSGAIAENEITVVGVLVGQTESRNNYKFIHKE